MKTDVRPENAERMTLRCAECEDEIEWCEVCDGPDCPVAVCYSCRRVALREMLAQPHTHGG